MRVKPGTIALLFMGSLLAGPVAGVAGTWEGWITDDHCNADNASDPKHEGCVYKCLKEGSKLVLYSTEDRQIYKLDKQDLAKQHIGHAVRVTGTLEGDKIVVESMIKKTEGSLSRELTQARRWQGSLGVTRSRVTDLQ